MYIYILTSLQLRMQIHMALCIYDLENKLVYELNWNNKRLLKIMVTSTEIRRNAAYKKKIKQNGFNQNFSYGTTWLTILLSVVAVFLMCSILVLGVAISYYYLSYSFIRNHLKNYKVFCSYIFLLARNATDIRTVTLIEKKDQSVIIHLPDCLLDHWLETFHSSRPFLNPTCGLKKKKCHQLAAFNR